MGFQINTKSILKTFSTILILGSIFMFCGAFGPILYQETSYAITKALQNYWVLDTRNTAIPEKIDILPKNSKKTLIQKPLSLKPVNTESSIVIEKIGVSAPMVLNVSVADEAEYKEALRNGVAHAKGTALPGQNGNSYIFAHSSLDFWELGKYATVFNLLGKLEVGDKIVLFYNNERFDYEVVGKAIVPGFNTLPLLRKTTSPVLTLQTCTPPGTTWNRLIVTAKLIEE